MNLYTIKQLEQLRTNALPGKSYTDHIPVVKLFVPGTPLIWLLTELDENNHAYCFRHFGFVPGYAHFHIYDNPKILASRKLHLKNDFAFHAKFPVSVYERAANIYGRIILDDEILSKFV